MYRGLWVSSVKGQHVSDLFVLVSIYVLLLVSINVLLLSNINK